MKKKITKIWGVGLVLVLAASLLLAAAPVSAGTLSWGDEDLPEELEAGNITDVAVSAGGGVIYVAHDSGVLFRSTNTGESWSSITVVDADVMLPQLVAVSPDDENYIAAAVDNATGVIVFISDDAGANWDSLGAVDGTDFDVLKDIALSPEKSGRHTVAVAGEDTGVGAEVWHYEIGSVGADWYMTSGDDGWDTGNEWCGAVAFSPNFASDEVLVAVTADSGVDIVLQIYSFNQDNWNSGTFADYPAEIVDDTVDADVDALDSASIAMSTDYLGSDDSLRVIFVGLTADSSASEDEASGIFRMDDDDSTALIEKKFIHSVDFDGTRLVAGHYDSTTVRRSADALASSPSVSGSTSRKGPGGENRTLVAFAGNEVVAGTSGDESAFAVSTDDGNTFNDISLIDTTLVNLEDVAVTPDGEMTYLLTNDGTTTGNTTAKDLSVWRLGDRWERVLSLASNDNSTAFENYIIRMAPDDGDVIYVAEHGSDAASSIYYTSDGGAAKWHNRVSRYDIYDLAVEGDGDVAYVLEYTATTSAHVSKSTNAGFTWATKKSHKISAGANMIISIGEDELLVAGHGTVSYSTDGNASWTKLEDGMPSGATVQAIASGLNDGDFVYAVTNTAAEDIYRWEIGEDDEWDDFGVTATGYQGSGIGLWEGALYVVSYNTTGGNSQLLRTLNPTDADPTWSTVDEVGDVYDVAPSALRASAAPGLTKLWAIDSLLPALVSYEDTLATAALVLTGPRDGMAVPMNPVSGQASHVTLTWETPSDDITAFDLEIALDSDFDEDVLSTADQDVSGSWDEGDIVSAVVGPGAARNLSFMPDTTYYWRVRVDAAGPVRSAWSEVRTFALGELEITPPVIIQPSPPAPVISVPPAPAITIQPPEIVLPQPTIVLPAPQITLPPAPAPVAPIPGWALYVIIIIGAVLVIALVVLILRTRRPV